VFAERFAGLGGGGVQWTNYLIVGGRLVGVFIQKADESTATRYFHTDHLGSISVITNESGGVVERLSVACPRVREAEPGERLGQAPQSRRQPRSGRRHHQRDQPRLHRPRAARLGLPRRRPGSA
jgi:hypothetical protein